MSEFLEQYASQILLFLIFSCLIVSLLTLQKAVNIWKLSRSKKRLVGELAKLQEKR